MLRRLSTLFVVSLAVMLALALGGYRPASASGPVGTYDRLSFPGASATNCGIWSLDSTHGVFQPGPSHYTETVKDGQGNVLAVHTGIGGFPITLFHGDSGTFIPQPKANPITDLTIMDGVVVANVSANDPCLPGGNNNGFQGPGIPAGYVLQIITCNTPVYGTPGGAAVWTGEAVKAGQTFYVNPVSVKDAKGTPWNQIFISSYVNAYIPYQCLGGAPAH